MFTTALFAVLWQSQADFDSFDSLAKADGLKLEIATKDFVDQGAGYKITGAAATAENVMHYRTLFLHEWSMYPPELMAKSKVVKIVLCTGLAVDGQIRAACPSFDLNTMYYDKALGSMNSHYQRCVVHHEFFHMLDQRMGILYRDSEWSKLNPPDFKYGSGGKNMRKQGVGELTDTIPGFLTPYGTAGVEEDKAELFAHMLIDPDYVKAQALKDSVLAQKMVLLRQRLTKYLPSMGDPFWVKQGWPAIAPTPDGGTRLGIAALSALVRRPAVRGS